MCAGNFLWESESNQTKVTEEYCRATTQAMQTLCCGR